jgi:hypothetical protein
MMKKNTRLNPEVPFFTAVVDGLPFTANQRLVEEVSLAPPLDHHYIFYGIQREVNLEYREIRIIVPTSLEFQAYTLGTPESKARFEFIDNSMNVYVGIEGTITLCESSKPEYGAVAAWFTLRAEDDGTDRSIDINGRFDMLLPVIR